MPADTDPPQKQSHCTDPLLETEEEIISECYEEFTRKHWEKIIKKLGLDEEHFYKALEEITKLNPRPAHRWVKPSDGTCNRSSPIS